MDGDTLKVSTPGGTRRVRLLCIDAPEMRGEHRTPLGDEAADFRISVTCL